MAEAKFEDTEFTNDQGAVKKGLKGTIYTMNADLVVEIEPEHDGIDLFRPEDVQTDKPSHIVRCLSKTGRFIFAGRAWTKNKGKGPMLSVSMSDPKANFSLWQDNETGEWNASGGAFS